MVWGWASAWSWLALIIAIAHLAVPNNRLGFPGRTGHTKRPAATGPFYASAPAKGAGRGGSVRRSWNLSRGAVEGTFYAPTPHLVVRFWNWWGCYGGRQPHGSQTATAADESNAGAAGLVARRTRHNTVTAANNQGLLGIAAGCCTGRWGPKLQLMVVEAARSDKIFQHILVLTP